MYAYTYACVNSWPVIELIHSRISVLFIGEPARIRRLEVAMMTSMLNDIERIESCSDRTDGLELEGRKDRKSVTVYGRDVVTLDLLTRFQMRKNRKYGHRKNYRHESRSRDNERH